MHWFKPIGEWSISARVSLPGSDWRASGQINIRVVPTRQAIEESVDRFTANVLPGQTSDCSRTPLLIDELIDSPKEYL